MQHILIIGAGRSSGSLIDYLKNEAEEHQWQIKIGDFNQATAAEKAEGHPHFTPVQFDIHNQTQTKDEIAKADLVISMLPARFHHLVAEVCVDLGKNLVTASYVSKEIAELDTIAKAKNTLILMECGLDPGIDHMTAMKVIDEIKDKGGKIHSFKSYTGGLVAPESDNNPWNYKFSWNPRNVVLAGQGTAKFIRKGKLKYIPYHQLFSRLEEMKVKNHGLFEGYPNRDSLAYREIYGLEDIGTMIRGTFRKPGFCDAWNVFVQLGTTDDSYFIEDVESMPYREFFNLFLPYHATQEVEHKICEFANLNTEHPIFKKLKWLGVFSDEPIGLKKATPAQVMQKLMEMKMSLQADDKDMIVMQHVFEYEMDGQAHQLNSSVVAIGENSESTAMAKTVGLPLGIVVKQILSGKIKSRGVMRPITKEIYEPALEELKKYNIDFSEEEIY